MVGRIVPGNDGGGCCCFVSVVSLVVVVVSVVVVSVVVVVGVSVIDVALAYNPSFLPYSFRLSLPCEPYSNHSTTTTNYNNHHPSSHSVSPNKAKPEHGTKTETVPPTTQCATRTTTTILHRSN